MKKLLLISFLFIHLLTYSQWSTAYSTFTSEVTSLCADTVNNKIYAATGGRVYNLNGTSWVQMGDHMNGAIETMVMYQDTLYIGGDFNLSYTTGLPYKYIAKWNGTNWVNVNGGMNSNVTTMTVGNGKLYVGGQFLLAGGIAVNNIASWNGSTWSALGTGLNAAVDVIKWYNNSLIVNGSFSTAGGISSFGIARWNGSAWSSLPSHDGNVYAMEIYNGELYLAGSFTNVNGGSTPASKIAKWNGTTWSALGSGVTGFNIYTMKSYNGSLYIGGGFNTAGGIPALYIAKWDNSSWSSVGGHTDNNVVALEVFNGSLFVGGFLDNAGGQPYSKLVKWNASATAIQEFSNDKSLKLYPNPFVTSSKLVLDRPIENGELNIFNVYGEKVKTAENLNGTNITIERDNLCPGVYFYDLISKNQMKLKGKFVIN